MRYTEKQYLFAKFMLEQIGFINNDLINAYLEQLESLYGKWCDYPSDRYISGAKRFYSVSDCIDILKDEIALKKNKELIKKNSEASNIVSATDLSNFKYCPASYSISKSFIIESPTGSELTEIGLQLHEKLKLITKEISFDNFETIESRMRNDVILKIKKSKVVFYGHNNENKLFRNKNFVGIPDYIFQDDNGKFFVVEEKFHKKHDPHKMTDSEFWDNYYNCIGYTDKETEKERKEWDDFNGFFYPNHIIQLLAYLENIQEYKIEYGYLVYWYYDFRKSVPYIHKVTARLFKLDENNREFYLDTHKNLSEFIEKKQMPFSASNLNMKKCAGCVVNKYCGHKHGKYSTILFPYDLNCLKLNFIPFPEELKKK